MKKTRMQEGTEFSGVEGVVPWRRGESRPAPQDEARPARRCSSSFMIRARTVSQGTVRTRPAAKSRDLLSSSPAHAAPTSSSGSSRLTNNSSATRSRSWRGRRRTSASNGSVDTDPSVPSRSGLGVGTHQLRSPALRDRPRRRRPSRRPRARAVSQVARPCRLRQSQFLPSCRRRETPDQGRPFGGLPPCSNSARASCRQVKVRSMYTFISSSTLASFVNRDHRPLAGRPVCAHIASWISSLVGGSAHPQQPPQMTPRTVRECGAVASASAFGPVWPASPPPRLP